MLGIGNPGKSTDRESFVYDSPDLQSSIMYGKGVSCYGFKFSSRFKLSLKSKLYDYNVLCSQVDISVLHAQAQSTQSDSKSRLVPARITFSLVESAFGARNAGGT